MSIHWSIQAFIIMIILAKGRAHDNFKFCCQLSFSVFRYKERLRTRYIKSLNPKEASKLLNAKNWTFIKDGLDDFRDGLPPPVEGMA